MPFYSSVIREIESQLDRKNNGVHSVGAYQYFIRNFIKITTVKKCNTKEKKKEEKIGKKPKMKVRTRPGKIFETATK